MKFEFVKIVDGEVLVYEGKTARTGDIVEFSDQFSEKALKNPDYNPVDDDNSKTSTEPRVKRKYTRRVKFGDEG